MAPNQIPISLAVLLATIILSGCGQDTTQPKFPTLDIEFVATIGANDDADANPIELIGDPKIVKFDRTGRVLVADQSNGHIKVFKQNGTFDGIIGKRGRGPGEFLGFDAMAVYGDSLFVVDHLQRRISLFTNDATAVKTFVYESPEIQWPREIVLMPNKEDLLLGYASTRDTTLFHVFNLATQSVSRNVGSQSQLLCNDDFAILLSALHFGRMLSLDKSTVRFIPEIYCGRQFDLDLTTLETKIAIQQTDQSFLNITVEQTTTLPEGSFMSVAGANRGEGHVINQSNGVAAFGDALFTFWTQLEADGRVQVVDINSADGQLLSRKEIPSWFEPRDAIKFGFPTRTVHDYGSDGMIAIVDWSSGSPIIEILKVDLNEL